MGAGLSAPFGYPAWHLLLAKPADWIGLSDDVKPLLDRCMYEEAAEVVSNALPHRFTQALRDEFSVEKLSHPIKAGAVRYLPRMCQGLVITTNFDCVLETVFEEAGHQFTAVFPGRAI